MELGAKEAIGMDGSWNSQEQMLDQKIHFKSLDFDKLDGNSPFRRTDLVISMEVAEHLKPESSEEFVHALTRISDVVLFSAAFVGQGGQNHINERKHSDWAGLFISHNFFPFDLFRTELWSDRRLEICYRQNAFLYVKKDTYLWGELTKNSIRPINKIDFMDCIHPELYAIRTRRKTASERMRKLIPNLLKSLKKTARKLLISIDFKKPI